MVVHPGAGNKSGTLLNALLHEYPELKKLPRAGIVHRLDKDTSGLMVVARNEPAMQSLSEQISNRSIKGFTKLSQLEELKGLEKLKLR